MTLSEQWEVAIGASAALLTLMALFVSVVTAIRATRDSKENQVRWITEMEANKESHLQQKLEIAVTNAKGVTVVWDTAADIRMNASGDADNSVADKPTVLYSVTIENPASNPIHDVIVVSSPEAVPRLFRHRLIRYTDGRYGFPIGHVGARSSKTIDIEIFLHIKRKDGITRATNTYSHTFDAVFLDIEGTRWATKKGYNSQPLEDEQNPLCTPNWYATTHSIEIPTYGLDNGANDSKT